MFASDEASLTTLVKMIWLLPVCPLFGTGETKLQPVHAENVAEGITRLMKNTTGIPPPGHEFGGPQIYTYETSFSAPSHDTLAPRCDLFRCRLRFGMCSQQSPNMCRSPPDARPDRADAERQRCLVPISPGCASSALSRRRSTRPWKSLEGSRRNNEITVWSVMSRRMSSGFFCSSQHLIGLVAILPCSRTSPSLPVSAIATAIVSLCTSRPT